LSWPVQYSARCSTARCLPAGSRCKHTHGHGRPALNANNKCHWTVRGRLISETIESMVLKQKQSVMCAAGRRNNCTATLPTAVMCPCAGYYGTVLPDGASSDMISLYPVFPSFQSLDKISEELYKDTTTTEDCKKMNQNPVVIRANDQPSVTYQPSGFFFLPLHPPGHFPNPFCYKKKNEEYLEQNEPGQCCLFSQSNETRDGPSPSPGSSSTDDLIRPLSIDSTSTGSSR
jgi:hypothetical protein